MIDLRRPAGSRRGGLPAAQQPAWPDPAAVADVVGRARRLPGSRHARGVRRAARQRLAAVSRGEAFVLQGGDCAETFAAVTDAQVRDKLRTILQMAVVLTYGACLPIVKIGRMGGQFAKPRSADVEAADRAAVVPRRRGQRPRADRASARTPDPRRMVQAYAASAETLRLLDVHTRGGMADLRLVHDWNKDFVAQLAGRRALRAAGPGHRPRAGVHAGLRRRRRPRADHARRRVLRQPRGAAARLRSAR